MKQTPYSHNIKNTLPTGGLSHKIKNILLAGSLGLSMVSAPLNAQTTDAADEQWRFQITPYLWLLKANGKLHHGIQGVPALSFSHSRSDILRDLNAAAFLSATARKKQWVFFADYSYASLSERDHLPYGLRAKIKLKQQIATLAGGVHLPTGSNHGLDLLAGARYWNVRTDLQLSPLPIERRFSKEFVEPVVGLRWRANFGQDQRWSVIGYGDVGGLGKSSRHSWQALATINYAISPAHYVSFGYRYLKLNYKSGGHRLNVDFSGPLLGFSYQF